MRGILVQPFGFLRNASAAWMSRQRSTTMGGLIGARCTPATRAAHPEKGALLFFSRCNPRFLPRRAECHRTFLDAERYLWVGLGLFCFVFAFFHSSVGVINAWVSTRRAWHLDAASRSASRRLAAGVSGLLYYFHIYFLRSPVVPLRLALIVCILFI